MWRRPVIWRDAEHWSEVRRGEVSWRALAPSSALWRIALGCSDAEACNGVVMSCRVVAWRRVLVCVTPRPVLTCPDVR